MEGRYKPGVLSEKLSLSIYSFKKHIRSHCIQFTYDTCYEKKWLFVLAHSDFIIV